MMQFTTIETMKTMTIIMSITTTIAVKIMTILLTTVITTPRLR